MTHLAAVEPIRTYLHPVYNVPVRVYRPGTAADQVYESEVEQVLATATRKLTPTEERIIRGYVRTKSVDVLRCILNMTKADITKVLDLVESGRACGSALQRKGASAKTIARIAKREFEASKRSEAIGKAEADTARAATRSNDIEEMRRQYRAAPTVETIDTIAGWMGIKAKQVRQKLVKIGCIMPAPRGRQKGTAWTLTTPAAIARAEAKAKETAARNDTIERIYREDTSRSTADIAKLAWCSDKTVRNVLLDRGVVRRQSHTAAPNAQDFRIAAHHAEGHNIPQCAAQFAMSEKEVRAALSRTSPRGGK
jgi:hypothetical protein